MNRTFYPQLDLPSRQQVHDYHLRAAEHCELASRCHKEAALHITGGDLRAASSQSKLADEYTGYAMLESRQAGSKAVCQTPATLQPQQDKAPLDSTAQQLLLSAIAFHEKAIKHHRHASLLYERGDLRQANTHASIACTQASSALASGTLFLTKDARLTVLVPTTLTQKRHSSIA